MFCACSCGGLAGQNPFNPKTLEVGFVDDSDTDDDETHEDD